MPAAIQRREWARELNRAKQQTTKVLTSGHEDHGDFPVRVHEVHQAAQEGHQTLDAIGKL
jgi:hypothetical protein